MRWLQRWITETGAAIEQAAELSGALAELPTQQTAFETIVRFAKSHAFVRVRRQRIKLAAMLTFLMALPAQKALASERLPNTSATPAPISLTLVGGPSVTANGITFVVSCQAPTGDNCNGSSALSTRHGLKVGEASFGVEPTQSQTVVVPLNQTARKLLVRSHQLMVTLTVTLAIRRFQVPNGEGSTSSIIATRRLRILALNTPRIAGAIELAIRSQRHIHAKVSCPALVIQRKGNDFVCVATTYFHKTRVTTPFYIRQQNDEGSVIFGS
jgi:hypothetical protein